MRTATPPQRRQTGFTLVELLVALALMALMAGMAVIYIFYAMWLKETTFVRQAEQTA